MSRFFPFIKKMREESHVRNLIECSQREMKVKPIGFDFLNPFDWLIGLISLFVPIPDKIAHPDRYKENEA